MTPAFEAFFRDVHGYDPFPWQSRLAQQVLAEGWPGLLDIPTGAGKTSALDVALYTLAIAPERMPRRTVLVVDRRIVVDQGAEHARELRRRLMTPAGSAAAEVAGRIRELWGAHEQQPPFAVAVLRGGAPRDDDWAKRPDQPVLGVSTVDQVGSRLLFRGYGVGKRSASIHAGLFGNDTLILLDEVHLSIPFAQTLEAIRTHYRKRVDGIPDRFCVVQMSATPGTQWTRSRFTLDRADRDHPVLAERLNARKRTRLVEVKVKGDEEAPKRAAVAAEAVKQAIEMQASSSATTVAIVVNRVDTARIAWELLDAHGKRTDRVLVTGRMRPIERDRVAKTTLLPRAGAGRPREPGRPVIVVATQCIEAGADLDFDGLVTECASLDALKQRFGRLDRRGIRTREAGSAPAVVLGRSDLIAERAIDPIYRGALAATWKWLGEAGHGDFDFTSVAAQEVPATLLAPTRDAPVLLPAHLDAWAHTSPVLRPVPDPDVSHWLHGPERGVAEVQIVWRADVAAPEAPSDVDEEVLQLLSLVRPSSLEALPVPLHAARAWLRQAPDERGIGDGLGEELGDEPQRRAKAGRLALVWGREDAAWIEPDDLRPGDILVVPSSYGGINGAACFDPRATGSVADIGDVAQLRGRGLATARLSTNGIAALGVVDSGRPTPLADETSTEARQRIAAWAGALPPEPPATFAGNTEEWSAVTTLLARPRRAPVIVSTDREEAYILVERSRKPVEDVSGEAVSEDDASSFTASAITLRRHCGDVRDYAARFARALGLSDPLVRDIAHAAWLHDVGKADFRFQRWLCGGGEVEALMLSEPLAKSALPSGNAKQRRQARRRAGYPEGYRHELLSLAMVQAKPEALEGASDRDLVMHLVASHHGWCRPFAPPLDPPRDDVVELDHAGLILGCPTRHGLARLDAGVAERFWRLVERYGWWGLAWMEAIVRLADHRASEDEVGE